MNHKKTTLESGFDALRDEKNQFVVTLRLNPCAPALYVVE